MYTFQIHVLIRFLTSFAGFEHRGFIIKKTVFTGSFYICKWKSVFEHNLPPAGCLHKCIKIITYKNCVYGLPDDEHMMLETCTGRKKSN